MAIFSSHATRLFRARVTAEKRARGKAEEAAAPPPPPGSQEV